MIRVSDIGGLGFRESRDREGVSGRKTLGPAKCSKDLTLNPYKDLRRTIGICVWDTLYSTRGGSTEWESFFNLSGPYKLHSNRKPKLSLSLYIYIYVYIYIYIAF